MRSLFLLVTLVSLAFSFECVVLQDSFTAKSSVYNKEAKSDLNATQLYKMVNEKIDVQTALLAYCSDMLSLSTQYYYIQEIRRDGKARDRYATLALQEFRKRFGIKPKVNTVYQNTGTRSTVGHRPSNFPSVGTKPMPPLMRF